MGKIKPVKQSKSKIRVIEDDEAEQNRVIQISKKFKKIQEEFVGKGFGVEVVMDEGDKLREEVNGETYAEADARRARYCSIGASDELKYRREWNEQLNSMLIEIEEMREQRKREAKTLAQKMKDFTNTFAAGWQYYANQNRLLEESE